MADKKTEGMLGSFDTNGNYVDPYGVTFYDGFTGKNLNNADTEKSAYGDDSTLATYNTGNNKGGTNDKYTGENTRNTYTGYNADIKTADLNPDYQYGGLAQQQESIDNSYIANRNDNIASALYNEGRRSIEDVADFLNQQQGFQNSTEEQRQNTINSVWKRIGQIAEQNKDNEPAQPETENTPDEGNNEALSNMESDLNQSTAGKLYGKVTADENTAINTLEDENSVYKAMNASRIQAVKDLQVASADALAAAIVSGSLAYDSQAMRDLMQYDPSKYQEIQTAVKQLRGQMNINTITSGEGSRTTTATNGQSSIANEKVDFATSNSMSNNAADILKSVDSSLNSNVNAASASETMADIEADMATLQNRLKNLKKEASTVFKGDVPQYIVNAYVANRTAEIQDQLSILENRYNAAYSRYQNEWEQTKRNAEYNLKKEELQLKKDAAALEDYATRQGIAIDWYKAMGSSTTTTTTSGNSVQTTSLTREEISTSIDELVDKCVNGELGNAQCAAGIQKYYLPTLGVDLGSLSAYSAKQAICTDLAGDYTPQKGDLVVMSSSTKPENGHIGIVVSVDGDTLKYLDWNGSLDANGNGTEKASVRTTKLSNSKIYGYYNPTHGQNQGSGGSEGDYNPVYADIYSNFLQGKMYTEGRLNSAIKSVGAKDVDELRSQAEAWKNAQASNESAMNMLRAVEYLMSQGANKAQRMLAVNDGAKVRGIGDIAGGIDRLFSGDAGNYNSYYHYIKDNMTLDHLTELKNNGATFGALSNQELDAIGNAALALSSDMGAYEFNSQLFTIYNKLRKNVGEQELTRSQFDEMIGAEDDSKAGNRGNYLSSVFDTSSASSGNKMNYSRNNNNTQQSQTGLSAAEKAKSNQGF